MPQDDIPTVVFINLVHNPRKRRLSDATADEKVTTIQEGSGTGAVILFLVNSAGRGVAIRRTLPARVCTTVPALVLVRVCMEVCAYMLMVHVAGICSRPVRVCVCASALIYLFILEFT